MTALAYEPEDNAVEQQPGEVQEIKRLLDEAANFELAHALRLYCHAHAAEGRLSSVLRKLMLDYSDAAMRRVDALTLRLQELRGRAGLPHIEVPATPKAVRVDSLLYRELVEALAATDRYALFEEYVGRTDRKTQALLANLRQEHAAEAERFTHLLETSRRMDAPQRAQLD